MNLDAIERRQRNAMRHLGQTVTISDRTYYCYPTGMRDNELRNRDQTFRERYDTSIAVISSDVTVEVGDKVTYNGSERRVLDNSATGDGLQNILHLGSLYGGD